MIQDLRDFFDDAVIFTNPDREEFVDPFGDLDLPTVSDRKYYRLFFGDIAMTNTGNGQIEDLSATLEIFNYREQGGFDGLMDEALCLKRAIIRPSEVKNSDHFTDIIVSSIEPFKIETNDRLVGMRLQLVIRNDLTY